MTLKHLSDKAILKVMGERIAQCRLNQNKSQDYLAGQAGISSRTMSRIESGHSVQFSSLIRILRALDLVENIDNLIAKLPLSPIQQLKLKGKERKRASKKTSSPKPNETWSWDDKP